MILDTFNAPMDSDLLQQVQRPTAYEELCAENNSQLLLVTTVADEPDSNCRNRSTRPVFPSRRSSRWLEAPISRW
jgi:hypothetical protein